MKFPTKATILACAAAGLMAGAAQADNVKVGLAGGISGPIAAMAPQMLEAKKLAVQQVNDQGGILKGQKLEPVIGDSGCNAQIATDTVTKMVNLSNVVAMVGPHCSGATLAAANTVTIPAGVAVVSPSATSPEVTGLDDKNTVFRTVPSDDYQGRSLARTLLAKGTKKVAVAYLNNDYGKGLAEAFKSEFTANGGDLAGFSAHEEGKASYRSELADLAKQGADTLIIFDYGDGSGLTILRQALENGFFENFIGGDGMKSDAPIKELGAENLTSFIASSPVGETSESLDMFNKDFMEAGGDKDAIFVTTSYDAAFLTALAIEKAGSTDRAAIAKAIPMVASAPGETVRPGEWAKAKKLIAEGKDINYKGAAGDHEFDSNGDVPGVYALFSVKDGKFVATEEMK